MKPSTEDFTVWLALLRAEGPIGDLQIQFVLNPSSGLGVSTAQYHASIYWPAPEASGDILNHLEQREGKQMRNSSQSCNRTMP